MEIINDMRIIINDNLFVNMRVRWCDRAIDNSIERTETNSVAELNLKNNFDGKTSFQS